MVRKFLCKPVTSEVSPEWPEDIKGLGGDQIDRPWNGKNSLCIRTVKKASTNEGEWVSKSVIGDEETGIRMDPTMGGLPDYGKERLHSMPLFINGITVTTH